MGRSAQVVIVMGSRSDLPVMKKAKDILDGFGVSSEINIVSAHRTPQLLAKSVEEWESKGVKVIIAGAGGAAHLPGMLASFSSLPVIGVPVKSSSMNGLDALLSIAQMPRGVPVATVAVDNADNAGLLAAQIVATEESKEGRRVRSQVIRYKKSMSQKVMGDRKILRAEGVSQFLKRLK